MESQYISNLGSRRLKTHFFKSCLVLRLGALCLGLVLSLGPVCLVLPCVSSHYYVCRFQDIYNYEFMTNFFLYFIVQLNLNLYKSLKFDLV